MRLPRFARNDALPYVFARLTRSAEAISGELMKLPRPDCQGGAMTKKPGYGPSLRINGMEADSSSAHGIATFSGVVGQLSWTIT